MNKKGQAVFIGIMLFIVVIITIIQFISPIKDEITTARSAGNLDCTNTSITVMQKATCVVVDTTLFYFVGVGIAIAAAALSGKKKFAEE